jgi:hypothetical protein
LGTVFKIIYSKLNTSSPGYIFRPPFVSQKKLMSNVRETKKSMTELDWAPSTKLVFNFFEESLNKDPEIFKK